MYILITPPLNSNYREKQILRKVKHSEEKERRNNMWEQKRREGMSVASSWKKSTTINQDEAMEQAGYRMARSHRGIEIQSYFGWRVSGRCKARHRKHRQAHRLWWYAPKEGENGKCRAVVDHSSLIYQSPLLRQSIMYHGSTVSTVDYTSY